MQFHTLRSTSRRHLGCRIGCRQHPARAKCYLAALLRSSQPISSKPLVRSSHLKASTPPIQSCQPNTSPTASMASLASTVLAVSGFTKVVSSNYSATGVLDSTLQTVASSTEAVTPLLDSAAITVPALLNVSLSFALLLVCYRAF